MSLYYQDDYVELWHGDCLTEHREWLDAHVLVTDPPYGMAYRGFGGRAGRSDGSKHPAIAGDADTMIRDAALAAWEGPALVFGKWSIERPANTRQVLIWDKSENGPGMGAIDLPWGPSFEEVYVLGKGWSNRSGRESSVYKVKPYNSQDADRPDHSTPKPPSLMELLIAKCPLGAIADPFAGSGATLIAAKNLRRQVVGVELEERHCETIARRLSQDVLDIFGGAA